MKAKKTFFHARPIFYSFLALMLAISTSKFIFEGNLKYIIFDLILIAIFVAYSIVCKRFTTLIVVLCVFLFGFGWFFVGLQTFEGREYVGEVQVVGRISDDCQLSKYGDSYSIVLKDVYVDGKKSGNIRLNLEITGQNDVKIGDIISFTGEVENVKLFELGSFQSFYYRDRTPYVASVSAESVVKQGNKILPIEKFRLKVRDVLYKNMGSTNGAVAYAVLFGDKSGIDDETYQAFKTAGVVHLLTVSGLHVSFLIALLGFFLKKCRIKGWINFIILAAFLGIYAYACNFSPSILRAGIMGLMLFSTQLTGKCYDNLNTLGLAGILIMLVFPLSALDLGFLMSFFCVLSILTISPWLSKLLRKVFPKVVADSFAVSIGVEIGILPFLANMFSNFNFLSFFVNLIVVPIFSVLYPILFVATLITTILPFFGFVLKGCGFGLWLIKSIASFFGETKLVVGLTPFDIFFVGFMFVGIYFASRYFLGNKRARVLCCGGAFALSGLFLCISQIDFANGGLISYAYNYSSSVVVLTNSRNESVIVDVGSKAFTSRLLEKHGAKNLVGVFVLQDNTYNFEVSRSLGIDTVVRSSAVEGYDEEWKCGLDEPGNLGKFNFCFKSCDGVLVGLEITFDNKKVFILRDLVSSARKLEKMSLEDYDFCIIGKQTSYAGLFDKDCIILAKYSGEYVNYSFQEYGNLQYEIRNQKWRCLD